MSPETVIQTRGLTKSFGSSRAIEDVTLDIERGEVFGLLGPNGAGKSTTLRCLLGLLKPTSGTCSIFEHDAWHDRVEAHRHIGVLPSDFAYEKELTGRKVLQLFARLRGIPVDERADALAERLHADLDRPQKELSRGNQQKIGLILALAHDPDIVIMDEPTAGLDPLMQEEFLRILAEISALGRTVLLSSHNMAEVERACDRVAMIHQAKVLEIATVSSVLERSPKEVHAIFAAPPSLGRFASIDGVSAARVDGNALELRVRGNVDAVVRAAAELEIVDFVCERPSLEAAFVQLYEDGPAADGDD
ncbi:MAG: ABC transporter ATP-binding protein [Thermoleophilaceae bacterium]|nr:ABC transporter ATP-binding protein [Thermoleophilaceae bacterium]